MDSQTDCRSGPQKSSGRRINHHNAKTALQTRREGADSMSIRQGFATKYEGLYWRPRKPHQWKPQGFLHNKSKTQNKKKRTPSKTEPAFQKLGSLGSSLGTLLDQTINGRRSLCANALPVCQTVLCNAQTFFTVLGGWVVETQTLDETTIAANALVGHDDVEERTMLGTAASKSNNDHNESFGWKSSYHQCFLATAKVFPAAFETRDMATRPATRSKVCHYSHFLEKDAHYSCKSGK